MRGGGRFHPKLPKEDAPRERVPWARRGRGGHWTCNKSLWPSLLTPGSELFPQPHLDALLPLDGELAPVPRVLVDAPERGVVGPQEAVTQLARQDELRSHLNKCVK